MKLQPKVNLAASVRQRLLNIARERRADFQLVLIRYAIERLLYRLSKSAHKNHFLLKGAMLFSVWSNEPFRPTRDLDFLGQGDGSVAATEKLVEEICRTRVEDDGLEFSDAIEGKEIREDLLLRNFLMPPTIALVAKQAFEAKWPAGGPWR